MLEENKATNQIPASDSQKFIARVERRDKIVKLLEILVLFALVAFNILAVVQNQKAADTRSSQAQRDRDESKGYIKCILLLRYDFPALNQDSPRKDVEAALDTCAQSKL